MIDAKQALRLKNFIQISIVSLKNEYIFLL